jgi:hypothetical protein
MDGKRKHDLLGSNMNNQAWKEKLEYSWSPVITGGLISREKVISRLR